MNTGEIKAGDMVEILGMDKCLRDDNDYEVGQICEVHSIEYDEDRPLLIYTEDKSNCWYFKYKEVKKV